MSHLDAITSAIDKHGPLTRGDLLGITGIKDTVLDATLTAGRKRGRLVRIADSGRWDVADELDRDYDEAPKLVECDPIVTNSTPIVETPTPNLQRAQPVAKAVCVPDMQTPQAPPMQTQTPSTPVATATIGNVVITITGVREPFAVKMLAAALAAAVMTS